MWKDVAGLCSLPSPEQFRGSSCCYRLWWPLSVVATFFFRYSDYTILSWYKAYMKTGYTTQNATPPLGCDLRSAAAQALSPEGSCYMPCCYRSSADMPQSRACARCLRATCWCRESSRVHSSSHECSRINSPYCRRTVPCLQSL